MTSIPTADLMLVAAQHAAASSWAAVAVVVLSVLLGTVVLIVWSRRDGSDGDWDQDPGGGPGGGGPPDAPGPAGPICWPEFERQFAEYVAGAGCRRDKSPAHR